MEPEFVTVAEAACYLKVAQQNIRYYLRAGWLVGEKHAITGRWRVRLDSLHAWRPPGKIWKPAKKPLPPRRFANEMEYLRSLR